MDIESKPHAPAGGVCIIEGVAGAGKDTLTSMLHQAFEPQRRPVYEFSEDALLGSWRHNYIPGIHALRLTLWENLLGYVRDVLAAEPTSIFLLNRLHVSFAMWRRVHGVRDASLEARHRQLLAALSMYPVTVLHAVLDAADMDDRSRHVERTERVWTEFLRRRMREGGPGATVATVYANQQRIMCDIIDRDGVPFVRVKVHRRPGAASSATVTSSNWDAVPAWMGRVEELLARHCGSPVRDAAALRSEALRSGEMV